MPFVSDLLTATPATAEGNPTPTRTWQWLRDGATISGATNNTYTVVEADIGAAISVRQTETNLLGSASAVSLATAAVAAFSPIALFQNSEEGAWYEPSTTTAFTATYSGGGFTDIAPAGYGDLCAILLDKSQGAGYSGGSFTGLGSELVAGGQFNDAGDLAEWSAGTVAAISLENNTMRVERVDNTQFSPQAGQQITGISDGATVLVTFQVTNVRNRNPAVAWADGVGVGATLSVIQSDNVVGSYELVSTFSSSTPWLVFYGGGDADFNVDNISVRELPGNHATQGTSTARPILARVPETGRRNLFTATNNVAGSPWLGFGASASLEALELDPNGNTGEVANITGSSDFKVWYQVYTVAAATEYTISAWVKSATGSDQTFALYGDGSQVSPNKTATTSWQRFEFTFTTTTATERTHGFADGSGAAAYDILVWGLQLELGSSATAYQKVVDQYDITEAGVTSLEYLAFDGSDDVISFTYASPLTQPQTAIVGATPYETSGAILGSVASSGTTRQLLYDNIFVFAGTQFDAGSLTNGVPYVLTPVWNTTSSSLRINGSLAASGSAGGNTRDGESIGGYGDGSALMKNMRYFGHVSINRLLTTDEIANTETYLAAKSGVPTELFSDTIYDRTFSAILDRSGATIERRA